MTKPKRSNFAVELEHMLDRVGMNKAELARAIDCSEMHVGNLVRGTRDATPDLINAIARKCRLSPRARVRLHRAAALDKGFQLRVPPPREAAHG